MTTNAEFSIATAEAIAAFHLGSLDEAGLAAALSSAIDAWGGSAITKAAIAQKIAFTLNLWGQNVDQVRNWWGGTSTGGWEADGVTPGGGRYPLTDALGFTSYLPCPAKVIELLAISAENPLTAGAISSLDPATDPAPGATDQAMALVQGGVLKRVNFFPARRTADLYEPTKLAFTELFPCFSLVDGLERRIAINQVLRQYSRIINPLDPDYGAKCDLQEVRDASVAAGSPNVHSEEGLFRPSDVGKVLHISNAGPSHQRLHTTIVGYVDSKNVTMAVNASVDHANNACAWGTDDTAAWTQAFADSAPLGTFNYGGAVLIPPGNSWTRDQKYHPRTALIGVAPRVSNLSRLHATAPAGAQQPLLKNNASTDDFPTMLNFTLWGQRYYQYSGSDLLQFNSVGGGTVLPQNDPYPMWANIEFVQGSAWALKTFGRHSGMMLNIMIRDIQEGGWQNQSYDVDCNTILAIACGGPGYADTDPNFVGGPAAANCNITTMKISFCGTKGTNNSNGCNILICGIGNKLIGVRSQESRNSNVHLRGAVWNKLIGVDCDDTACIAPSHPGYSSPTLATVRAAFLVTLNTAADNVFTACSFGRSVHNFDYLTHGVYLSGDTSYNRGQFETRHDTSYSVADHGTDSSGGWGATNRLSLNGALLT